MGDRSVYITPKMDAWADIVVKEWKLSTESYLLVRAIIASRYDPPYVPKVGDKVQGAIYEGDHWIPEPDSPDLELFVAEVTDDFVVTRSDSNGVFCVYNAFPNDGKHVRKDQR